MLQSNEIEGHPCGAERATHRAPSPRARKRRADQSSAVGHARIAKKAVIPVPSALDTNRPEEGRNERAEQATGRSPLPVDTHQAAEGQLRVAEQAIKRAPSPLDTIVAQIVALQKQRRFCIKSQSRIDRSMEAFMATCAGYRPQTNPDGSRITDAAGRPVQDKAGKALWAEIGRVRRAVEAHKQIDLPDWANAEMILISAASRRSWDEMRTAVEKKMEKLAKQLPVWPWWEQIRGVGAKGLAIIVGECGNIGDYRDKSAVWKRLGLAVINGERQRRASGEAALAHAFNPARRAEIWTIADSMFRAQWRGADEETGRPAGPIGPYGEKYAHRRAVTASREGWSPARQNADARRYMTKALIRDLRAAWRQADTVTQ